MLALCLHDLSKHDLKQVPEGGYRNLNSAFSESTEYRLFLRGRKNIKLLEYEQIIHHFKARDLEIPNIYLVSRNIQISQKYGHLKKFRKICSCSCLREI